MTVDKIARDDNTATDNLIHADMTFREAGRVAFDVYSTAQFQQFREEFECLRQEHSTGLGQLKSIPIFKKNAEPTLKSVFSVMDPEQSQRFSTEFFEAIIPHWRAQRDIWQNIHKGTDGAYTYKMEGSWINRMLFKMLAKSLSESSFVDAVVFTQQLTWMDDDKKTLSLRASFFSP